MGNESNQNEVDELTKELSECFKYFLELNAKNIISTAENLRLDSINFYETEMKKVKLFKLFCKNYFMILHKLSKTLLVAINLSMSLYFYYNLILKILSTVTFP